MWSVRRLVPVSPSSSPSRRAGRGATPEPDVVGAPARPGQPEQQPVAAGGARRDGQVLEVPDRSAVGGSRAAVTFIDDHERPCGWGVARQARGPGERLDGRDHGAARGIGMGLGALDRDAAVGTFAAQHREGLAHEFLAMADPDQPAIPELFGNARAHNRLPRPDRRHYQEPPRAACGGVHDRPERFLLVRPQDGAAGRRPDGEPGPSDGVLSRWQRSGHWTDRTGHAREFGGNPRPRGAMTAGGLSRWSVAGSRSPRAGASVDRPSARRCGHTRWRWSSHSSRSCAGSRRAG